MSIADQIKIQLVNLILTDYSKYKNLYCIKLPYHKYRLYCIENGLSIAYHVQNYVFNDKIFNVYNLKIYPHMDDSLLIIK